MMFFRVPKLCLSVLVVALLGASVAADAGAATAGPCVRPGDQVLSRTDGMTFISRTKSRTGWKKGPSGIYACSLTYGRRVFLMDAGVKNALVREFSAHAGNPRYAAFVSRYSSLVDAKYGLDTQVHVVDLKSGKPKSDSSPHSAWRTTGSWVTALAINERGWAGWISYAFDIGVNPDLPQGSWETEVHLRDSGRARVVARSDAIDRNFLRFDTSGSNLIWTTATTTAPAH